MRDINCGQKKSVLFCLSCLVITLMLGLSQTNLMEANFFTRLQTAAVEDYDQLCSLDIISDHVTTSSFFPSDGKWMDDEDADFAPTLCRFSPRNQTHKFLRKCQQQKKISNYLLLGDSNGRRYFDALLRALNNTRKKSQTSGARSCKVMKQGPPGNFPGVAYFTQFSQLQNAEVAAGDRDCATCREILASCSGVGDVHATITVEFLSMEHLWDSSVRTKCKPSDKSCQDSAATTRQEFIFKKYLKNTVHPYPDVIIIFANCHDILKFNRTIIENHLHNLVSVLKEVPGQTRVVMIPVMGQYYRKLPEGSRYQHWKQLYEANQVWFDVLKSEIVKDKSKWYTFFDLQTMSKDVLPKWAQDSVHLAPVWYDRIISYIIQSLCV